MSTDHSRVIAAMAAIPRARFLPDSVRDRAALDEPLPIGHGATNSQPWTVQFMLELLRVPEGATVLDVGSGSGWTTALLAHLVGAGGSVRGVEVVPELVAMGTESLSAFHLPWAEIVAADPDRVGAPDHGPFDRILVSADAGGVPEALETQLAAGGRMVLPAAGVMWVVDRDHEGWHREPVTGYRFAFVPLV
ncbi:MAG: class I SAM-dependent methyltransferase [Propionicimonas sp.]|uniref:protein-L-isoaspartate O-methyltransferase family protein n=1 Tax=Propionicimonas sp. TaxID=1955623 RepID=UPI003D0F7EB1